jgi:uncharacterized membrane protein YozB (DUF420 family)
VTDPRAHLLYVGDILDGLGFVPAVCFSIPAGTDTPHINIAVALTLDIRTLSVSFTNISANIVFISKGN